MKGIKRIISSIALSSLVAACGSTMSVAQHRSEAQRYEEAARVAQSRGDAAEAMRDEALAREHAADARNEEELLATDTAGAP